MSDLPSYRDLMDGLSDAVIAADEDNAIVYLNRAAENLLGWRWQELRGKPLTAIMPPRMRALHQAGFRRYVATRVGRILGKPIRVPALRYDGSEVDVELTLSTVTQANGRLIFIGAMRDLRERVELERQIVFQQRLLAQHYAMVAMAEAKTFEQAGEGILKAIGEAMGWPVGLFWAANPNEDAAPLRAAAAWTASGDAAHVAHLLQSAVPLRDDGIFGEVSRTGKPAWRRRVGQDELYRRRGIAGKEGLSTALVFPVVCADVSHGFLEFISERGEDPDEELLGIMEGIGFQIAQFVERLGKEEELRESQEWLATTLSSIGDGIIATDAEGRIRFLNPIAEALTGWSLSESRGRPLADVFRIVNERTRQPLTGPVEEAIRERRAVALTNRILLLSKEGVERLLEDSASPIVTREAKFRGVVLCFRDATEKRRAERERQDLLRKERIARNDAERERGRAVMVASAVPSIIWTSDANGVTDFYNRRWYEYSGVDPHASDADAWREVVHPDDLASIDATADTGYRSREPFQVEIRLRRASDRAYRWHLARATPLKDETGRVIKWIGSTNDIEDQKRAEANARFLAEASAIVSASLDYERTLEEVAKFAVTRFADWCAIALVGNEGIPRQLALTHADPDKASWAQSLRGQYGVPQVVRDVIRTGQPVLVADVTDELLRDWAIDEDHLARLREIGARSAVVVALRARGAGVGAMTLIFTELGRRYDAVDLALAQELADRAGQAIENARLYKEAEEAIRVRDDFLSIASHELKTPLTALQLHVQAIQRSLSVRNRELTQEQIATKVDSIGRQVNRLGALVNNLLDISRITGRRLELANEPVDLAGLTREVASRFSEDLMRVRCELSIEAPDVVVGWWDELRLDQIISNLLENATKFGAGKAIEIVISATSDRARLRVTDHGIGIAAVDQARIFDRFERAVPSKHFGGFGLGLWIVGQIVEALGGSIRVESEVGEGASFIVELPRDRGAPRTDEPLPMRH